MSVIIMFGRRFRAQSAMEYLMTYGWAILIIAVVLGALFSLGVFNGSSLLGTSCVALSGYYCSTPVLSHSTSALTFTLGQATGTNYGNVIVYTVPSGSSYNPGSDTAKQAITSGISSGQTVSVSLTLPSTSPYSTSGYGTIGDTYTGYIYINYSTSSTGVPNTVAEIATISVKSS